MPTDTENILPRGTGLKPLEHDTTQDFQLLGGTFKVPALDELPAEFYVGELIGIKDQGQTDFCAGYATAAASEDQEMVELNGPFSFMAAKKLLGEKDPDAWKSWGLNLKDVCEASVKIGALEEQDFPFRNDDRAGDRDFLANPENWPEDVFILAEEHKKGSFWDATKGPYDLFDNLRASLWLNRNEARSIITGVVFRRSWARTEEGIIPHNGYENDGEGHAMKAFGWTTIEGEVFLAVVNSWGRDVGAQGIHYFPREVVNREFHFGGYTLKDMSREDAETYIEYGFTPDDTPIQRLWKVVFVIIKRFFNLK